MSLMSSISVLFLLLVVGVFSRVIAVIHFAAFSPVASIFSCVIGVSVSFLGGWSFSCIVGVNVFSSGWYFSCIIGVDNFGVYFACSSSVHSAPIDKDEVFGDELGSIIEKENSTNKLFDKAADSRK
ncbi:hypothetical protein C2G38_2029871 [Gigaspora rosea]|uniref:Uncharacterized protein n=1 Tax=Gigaspora rosea TaxID=44941 RepID=A0A397VY27_9GLOM|nr:hypothetical protein C2G38_2029871 [Gigaspora rosea]